MTVKGCPSCINYVITAEADKRGYGALNIFGTKIGAQAKTAAIV